MSPTFRPQTLRPVEVPSNPPTSSPTSTATPTATPTSNPTSNPTSTPTRVPISEPTFRPISRLSPTFRPQTLRPIALTPVPINEQSPVIRRIAPTYLPIRDPTFATSTVSNITSDSTDDGSQTQSLASDSTKVDDQTTLYVATLVPFAVLAIGIFIMVVILFKVKNRRRF